MPKTLNSTSFSDQIELLRVRLESALPLPMFLLMSSARAGDGKGLVASSLARSMDAAGYSTLLVVADENSDTFDGSPAPKTLDDIAKLGVTPYVVRSRSGLRTLAIPSEKFRHSASRESVARFAALCRTTYQVTIVEATTALSNSFSMLTAVAADGVLLTVREGRRATGDDRKLAKAMATDGAPFLGVITINDVVIRSAPAMTTEIGQARSTVPTVAADIETRRAEQAV